MGLFSSPSVQSPPPPLPAANMATYASADSETALTRPEAKPWGGTDPSYGTTAQQQAKLATAGAGLAPGPAASAAAGVAVPAAKA